MKLLHPFRRRQQFSLAEQINGVVEAIVEYMRLQHQKAVVGEERARVRADLRRMFAEKNLKTIYKNFYAWLGHPEMFKSAAKGALEYADVFPLIYLHVMLGGASAQTETKHVVVDEMQDYTPVQYRVIAELYPCKMTILGDRNQSVSPLSSSCAESIRDVLPQAECVYMQKSYRSTVQITNVAQSILHNPDLIPIERHGDEPGIHAFSQRKQELGFVLAQVRAFSASGRKSLGIICKTQKQAAALYQHLQGEGGVRLIDADSKLFSGGTIIATAYLAKGLEFDEVLIPFCNDAEYKTLIDRHMLYVGVTRAMHRLSITHTGPISPFLAEAAGPERAGKGE